MGYFQGWRPGASIVRTMAAASFAVLLVALSVSAAFAGTTGVIRGTVTDAQTKAPLANVQVTASSPSGTYSATTNARGFYSMLGVFSDTYMLSFQIERYKPVSIPGVVVFADQSQVVNASLTKQLKTIAKVVARSSGGAFQPNQTVDTYTVTATQAKQLLGNNINLSESQLITSLPGAMTDSSGYPVIRGGRENEEAFQFEGIPYTDAFTNQFVNTLALPGQGVQSLQLTPGVGNASVQNYGTGSLNLVVKRGTYPGYAQVQVGVRGPAYAHSLNAEYGFASPNGQFSDYMTFAGRNFSPTYGGNPSVNANSIGEFFGLRAETDREFVNNFVYRFGKNNGQTLQFFTDIADHHFYGGYGGFNQLCFRSCDPYFLLYGRLFTGLTVPQIQSIVPLDPYQTSPTERLGQANRPPFTYYQPLIAYKVQYTNNLNSSTYLSAMYYNVNAVTTFDFPERIVSAFYPSFVLQQGGFSKGVKLDITKQLSEKNLLKVGGSYAYLTPVYNMPTSNYGFWNAVFTNGEQYDFLPVSNGGTGYLAAHGIPAGTRMPNAYENSIATRQEIGLYVNDTWTPNDRFKADAGVRMDGTNDHLPPARMDASCQFLYLPSSYATPGPAAAGNPYGVPAGANVAYPGNCGTPTFNVTKAETQPRIIEPVLALDYRMGINNAVRASYGRSVEFPPLGQIDFYATPGYYGAFNSVPSSSNYYGGPATTCGVFADTLCSSYGNQLYWDNQQTFAGNPPLQPVRPEVFSNYDFSYSHQFTKGLLNGVQFKLTPWLRKGQDVTAATQTPKIVNGKMVTDLNGNPIYNPQVVTNLGYSLADGIEMDLTREVPIGLSFQFAATYINEFSSVVPLSPGEDFFPSIPAASLALGNKYRVGFLSPFQTTLALSYQTRSGWRINPVFHYNEGYPTGSGLYGAAFIDGAPYNIPNTNYSAGTIGSPAGSTQYVDPMNPGSMFAPNIDATRGTPEAASPGGELTHPNTTMDVTFEYTTPRQVTFGMTILDAFNEIYGGAGRNPLYQPVATGISGPLSGQSALTYFFGPANGFANLGSNRFGNQPYIDTPFGQGRQIYFYVTTKI